MLELYQHKSFTNNKRGLNMGTFGYSMMTVVGALGMIVFIAYNIF
ncbi:hypothetical protein [Mannheimia granulomatis]|nr:hypothetical protein [Mannheimia granulomatis]